MYNVLFYLKKGLYKKLLVVQYTALNNTFLKMQGFLFSALITIKIIDFSIRIYPNL